MIVQRQESLGDLAFEGEPDDRHLAPELFQEVVDEGTQEKRARLREGPSELGKTLRSTLRTVLVLPDRVGWSPLGLCPSKNRT